MKKPSWLKRFIGGLAMGVAASIPGVSAGALAIIFHIFDLLIYAASNFFKKFKEAFLILLPIVLGVICAAIPMIALMHVALKYLLFAVVSLFAGFMIGSFPNILNEVKETKPNKKEIILCIICLLVALAIGIISLLFGEKIDIANHVTKPEWYMFLIVIPVGIIASAGLIVPGISGSMILLIMGFYTPFINNLITFAKVLFRAETGALNWQFILLLLCFAVGVIIGCVLVSKLLRYFMTKNRRLTFFGIIGFFVGSTISLFVNHDIGKYYQTWGAIKWYYEVIIAVVLLALGVFIALKLTKLQAKSEAKENEGQNQ